MKTLRQILLVSFVLAFVGSLAFYFLKGLEEAVWFAFGAGAALMNLLLAFFLVQRGLHGAKSKGLFLGFLLMKSLSFIALVAVVLLVLKPALLPFTSGIGIVIVGATFWAGLDSLKRITGITKGKAI